MKWFEKRMEGSLYLESSCGKWRIAKNLIHGKPVYTLFDHSNGYWKLIGTFKTAEDAKGKAE